MKRNVKRSKAKGSGTPRGQRRAKRGEQERANKRDIRTLFPNYRKRKFRGDSDLRTAKYIKELRDAYLHAGLALYVGAGVSRSIGLPGWSELMRDLTLLMMMKKVGAEFAASGNTEDENNWQAIAKIQEDVAKMTDYNRPMLMMARAIKDELKDQLPETMRRILYGHLRRAYYANVRRWPELSKDYRRDKIPRIASPLLNALVCLARAERDTKGVQAIINYNYDDTLDDALTHGNVRCITVTSGKDQVPQGALPCYHVHGLLPLMGIRPSTKQDVLCRESNFVFSEDEYHAEYSDPYRWSNMTQIGLLGRYTGLFVGLSLEDPNIRRLVDVTHTQYPEGHNYAILPRKRSLAKSGDTKATVLRNLFEEVETKSFEKIGIRVIWVDRHEETPCVLHEIYTGERITPSKASSIYGNVS